MPDRRGLLIILSSPSGAGKSTMARRLREWDGSIRFSVSATTRARREGETDGEDYHFVDEERFERMIRDGEMLEHARVFGNMYGSPLEPVRDAVSSGTDVLFDIDWQGELQIRNSDLAQYALTVFLLPPTMAELRDRLKSRDQDDGAVIRSRMDKSLVEIAHWGYYDYVLVNDDEDETFETLRGIVAAARQRRLQQPDLKEHVRRLEMEFEALR